MHDLKPWFGDPPHTSAPDMPGYWQSSHEQINIGKVSVVGVVLIPLWFMLVVSTIAILGGRSEYSVEFSFTVILILAVLIVAVVLMHELVHGAVAALLGAKPAFGVGPGFAYTTFLEPMSKSSYLAVGLAPLVLLTAGAIGVALAWPALAGWMVVAATINASGAIGDLWMTWRIVRAPRGSMFYDLADGFAVYVPADTPS